VRPIIGGADKNKTTARARERASIRLQLRGARTLKEEAHGSQEGGY